MFTRGYGDHSQKSGDFVLFVHGDGTELTCTHQLFEYICSPGVQGFGVLTHPPIIYIYIVLYLEMTTLLFSIFELSNFLTGTFCAVL